LTNSIPGAASSVEHDMRLSPKHTVVLSLAIGALALAACGDEEDGGDASASAGSSALSVVSVDGTDALADADGRTLYTADVEAGGEILCTRGCEAIWDPALGSDMDAQAAADDTGAEIGVVERPNGDSPLALDDTPLYAFTEEGPGELTGDGFADEFEGTPFVWSVATAPGAAAPTSDEGGSGSGYGGY
jgi:predicted lipoprotein with Yx(FWY)xxD motif